MENLENKMISHNIYIYVKTHNTGYITTKIRIQTIYMLKC